MNEEDLVEVERLAHMHLEMSAEPRASTEAMETSQRAREVAGPSLADDARASAKAWVAGKKVTGCAVLEVKLDRAMASILEAGRRVSGNEEALQGADSEARDLSSNLRVLRAASREVRETLQLDLPVRQVSKREAMEAAEAEITGGEDGAGELPRPYVAARAYLSAVKYLFDEGVFAAYMQAFEEHGYFEMHEIWALKPMMQLVVLECIAARFAAEVAAPPESATDKRPGAWDAHAAGSIPFAPLLKSLHRLSHTELKDSFNTLSRTEALLGEDPVGAYPLMDFESCDLYRNAIQRFAMASDADEFEIARLAVEFSRQAMNQKHSNERARERRGHVGFYLLGRGRKLMKQQIGYKPRGWQSLTENFRESPEAFYFLTLEFLVFLMMFFVVSSVSGAVPIIAAVLLLILPASESAVEIVNQLVTFLTPVRALPRMDFSRGIPEDCLTIVAVPTLLINEDQIRDLVRSLEIRYVGNRDAHLFFALLTDPPDSEQRFDERDQFVSLCSGLIEGLNRKYGRGGRGPFLHFHRHRVFNEIENKWMGWERKRGKLLDFNDFLRGQYDRFPVKVGDLSILPRVRYVITLDSDTQLPRESAHRLVGTLAHPLNRASVNPATNAVDEGYGVLQPRVGISVQSANQSRLAYIYSGQTGLDIYARAVSDVYQDLFGEGIFTGKGIYEVDVFRQVLGGRFPSNAILSHDLIEGAYARAGLVSDVEIIDDYPSHFSAHSRRKHRWIRGDWQILRWLLPRVPDAQGAFVKNPLDVVSRWKILDNLRRSVIEAATFVLLLAAWFYLPGSPAAWTAATVALMLVPSYVQLALGMSRLWRAKDRAGLLRQIFGDFTSGQITVLITLTFLAHQMLVTLDAIARTVFRLTVSRRHLLEWETAAQSEMDAKKKRTPVDVYLDWTPVVGLLLALAESFFRPAALLSSLPILALWMLAKPAAQWLDRPLHSVRSDIDAADEDFLRMCALKTWRYFRELASAKNNWLIPDNVQEEPRSVAHRLSPTNLGLQFNAQYAAYDLGFLDAHAYLDMVEKTLASAKKLPRVRGHFLNWFDTVSLAAIGPRFLSSVDSGNLACSLWCVKQGSLDIIQHPVFRTGLLRAVREHLGIAAEECEVAGAGPEVAETFAALRGDCARLGDDFAAWFAALQDIEERLRAIIAEVPDDVPSDAPANSAISSYASARWWLLASRARVLELHELVDRLTPWMLPEYAGVRKQVGEMLYGNVTAGLTLQELPGFVGKLQKKLDEYSFWSEEHRALQALRERLPACRLEARETVHRLAKITEEADVLVQEMDFRFLYNAKRKMLSVGYDVEQNELVESCYDLLASEARSAVFVAIAKGDIPQSSWFQLGRVHTHFAGRDVLLSWTGTMFEYLMPMLWMKTYPETLLASSMSGAVACQRAVVEKRGIPWGISEGASSVRNHTGHYEYHAFGVKALALKTETPKRLVITPYAAFLALNVDPANAVRNLRAMHQQKWVGALGFYESADYGRPKRGEKIGGEIVRSWMAHHQGMSLLSVANLLSNAVFQRLFHEEVMVAGTERILHERKPSTTNREPAAAESAEWAP
jgi:cyclic beta-1,2-glucan synthetase